jgi:hypothetical protein
MADVQPSDKPIAARAYAEREATRSRSASRSPGRRRRGTSNPLILLPLMMTDVTIVTTADRSKRGLRSDPGLVRASTGSGSLGSL